MSGAARQTAVVPDATALLQIYDNQLRGESEVPSASELVRHGPLIWASYLEGRGFVCYRSMRADAGTVAELVAATVQHYSSDPEITRVEWKSRGHDPLPHLDAILRAAGFVPDEFESVMLGEASALAVDVPLPDGVAIRRVEGEADVRRMCAMQAEVFGGNHDDQSAALLHRLALGRDDLELWVAEAGGGIVSAGRLEPVAGTDVAGIWGGCTRLEWRGRGVYRALSAERARSALRRGCRFLHSDSTEFSRPILERSGFVKVTTTTPYEWRRDAARQPSAP